MQTPDSRSEQRSLPPEVLVSVLNQQLGNRWQAGPIQLVNLQQDRPVPQHLLLQQHLPEAAASRSWLETHQQLNTAGWPALRRHCNRPSGGPGGTAHGASAKQPLRLALGNDGNSSNWYPNLILSRQRWQPISGSV